MNDAEYILLQIEDVLEVHHDQIELYGGSTGVRDMGLLDSAVKAPAATAFGEMLHKNVFELAAAYLYYLVKNHAFIDGNKRVGLASALLFLDLNGIDINVDSETLSAMVLAVATDQLDKAGVADFFRLTAQPRP